MNKPIEELIQRLKEPDYQFYGCELSKGEADLAISALTQQLNNGWIPVSERLPEESIDGITDDYVSYNVSLKFEYAECTRTYKYGQRKWWNNGTDMSEYVIAWQNLPEPYKEVSE